VGAPAPDFVFTLCNPKAGELPHWPRRPVTGDWYYPEPNRSGETWRCRKEITVILRGLERQLLAFMQLPFEKLDEISLRERLRDIGYPVVASDVDR
jgi:hypothetical protein